MEHFFIHSAVRKRHTRLHRMKAPQHHDLVQRLAGGKFVVRRTRPVRVSEEALLQHIDEITRAVEEGRIDVRTPDGRVVSLDMLRAAPRPASRPQPKRRLDSAAHDKPQGFERPMFQEGRGAGVDVPLPEVIKEPLLSKQEPEAAPEADQPPAEPPAPPAPEPEPAADPVDETELLAALDEDGGDLEPGMPELEELDEADAEADAAADETEILASLDAEAEPDADVAKPRGKKKGRKGGGS